MIWIYSSKKNIIVPKSLLWYRYEPSFRPSTIYTVLPSLLVLHAHTYSPVLYLIYCTPIGSKTDLAHFHSRVGWRESNSNRLHDNNNHHIWVIYKRLFLVHRKSLKAVRAIDVHTYRSGTWRLYAATTTAIWCKWWVPTHSTLLWEKSCHQVGEIKCEIYVCMFVQSWLIIIIVI